MRLFADRSYANAPALYGSGLDDAMGRTEASVRVNHDTVLSDDAILAAVSLLAGDIATLPMKAFMTTENGLTQPLTRQPSWIEAPDPLDLAITDVAHKTQVALSLLLAGNAYVLCEPSVLDPISLTVLNPVRLRVIKPGRERLFQVMGRANIYEDWAPTDVLETLSSAQVMHIPYMLRPGRLMGLSPVDAQMGNLGISLAMRKWVETFFGKGGQVAGFVVLPETVAATAANAIEERFEKKWSSWRKAGIIGVLSGGASYMKTGLTPQDANLTGLWGRQLEVAARIYGIPPFMIGSQEPAGVAYASSVERAQHYIDHCMARYTRPMEKAYSRLVPGDGRLASPHSNTEIRFVYDAFLRGDPAARWAMYTSSLEVKARTIDEVRALENLHPMSEKSTDELNGAGGLLQTPNNNATPSAVSTMLEELKVGLITHDEARAETKRPPIKWPDELGPDEVTSLIEQVKAGLLTEDEARELMKRPAMKWADGPSPDEINSMVAQIKEGLLTIDEARAELNRPKVEWPEDLSEKVGQATELIKAGFDPDSVMSALGLPKIKHIGLPPVTVQKLGDAEGGPETAINPDVPPKTAAPVMAADKTPVPDTMPPMAMPGEKP